MSEVNFNYLNSNYDYYKGENKASGKNEEAQKPETKTAGEHKQADANNILDALNLIGSQNFAMTSATKASIDPAKYLSEERIASIEDSMAAFEAGTDKYASAIQSEFGGILSEATIQNLAARAFAKALD